MKITWDKRLKRDDIVIYNKKRYKFYAYSGVKESLFITESNTHCTIVRDSIILNNIPISELKCARNTLVKTDMKSGYYYVDYTEKGKRILKRRFIIGYSIQYFDSEAKGFRDLEMNMFYQQKFLKIIGLVPLPKNK